MPKEKFYEAGKTADEEPYLEVAWGVTDVPQVTINGIPFHDRSGLNRLIGVLRKARNQVYGADE